MNIKTYPLVSVIIPFYNHNHFIKQTLDSILEDSYPNKEIIIINDGSTNPNDTNIQEWIQKHKNANIQYIKRENKGVTKTLNELINLAKGDFILPCASDDYLINNTITDRVNLLLKLYPNKLILISDNIVIDDRGKEIYSSNLFEYHKTDKELYFNDDGLKDIIINQWSFAGASWIAHKDLFKGKESFSFNEDLIVEDWDFFLKIVAKNLVSFYDDKVSAYRLHDNNTCRDITKRLRMYKDLLNSASNNLEYFDKNKQEKLLKEISKYEKLLAPPSLYKRLKQQTKGYRYIIKDFFNYAK